MAYIIQANGQEKDVYPKGKHFTNEEIGELINSPFGCVKLDSDTTLFFYEEGYEEGLMFNEKASNLIPDSNIDVMVIYGAVLVCNKDESGDVGEEDIIIPQREPLDITPDEPLAKQYPLRYIEYER